MKKVYCLIGALCVVFFAAAQAAAQGYENLGSRDGVDVMAKIDPLGPNNLVAVYVKFVNNNDYKVKVKWTPIMTCSDGETVKGYGEDFDMNEKQPYEATIWRSGACGARHLKDIRVEFEVSRADGH